MLGNVCGAIFQVDVWIDSLAGVISGKRFYILVSADGAIHLDPEGSYLSQRMWYVRFLNAIPRTLWLAGSRNQIARNSYVG